ncbi:unnamed protein product, partial [Choristocarpus tenellus]
MVRLQTMLGQKLVQKYGSKRSVTEGREDSTGRLPDKGETNNSRRSTKSLSPSIARNWRAFDVAKQIEHEIRQQKKAEAHQMEKARFREELELHRSQQAENKAREEGEKR